MVPQMVLALGLLLTAEEGKISVRATDLELTLQHAFPAEVSEAGSVTVPAKLFSSYLGNLAGGLLELVWFQNEQATPPGRRATRGGSTEAPSASTRRAPATSSGMPTTMATPPVTISVTRGVQVSFTGNIGAVVAATATSLQVATPKLNPGTYQVIVANFDGQYSVAPRFLTVPGP